MKTKNSLTAILFIILTTFPAIAGFKVPKSVFTIDQLEEAKTKAIKSEKPLVFLYTDDDGN